MLFYLCEEILKNPSMDQAHLFNTLMQQKGVVFRYQKGRSTQEIKLGEQSYFIKQHRGVGWKEILKNCLSGRLPILSAKNEWLALEKCAALGIAVPRVLGYGLRGANPARQESFVLMENIDDAVSLEALSKDWQINPPSVSFKRKLILSVAKITRTLHESGINHRDLYICHFLLKQDTLYLIDLHRAALRQTIPLRWRIKDLAGLYFSSKTCGLTKRDYLRFMKAYRAQQLKVILKTENDLWKKVKQRGEKLYCDHR